MIHALQYQNTIICTNKIQGITGVVRTSRTCFAVCPQLCECTWVKNPAMHKGSEEPLKIHHQAQPPNPNQSLHHSGNYHQLTSATEEGSLGLDEESSDEIPKSCGKQQREAWEDGRMSSPTAGTRASAATRFLHSTLSWTLIQNMSLNTWAPTKARL